MEDPLARSDGSSAVSIEGNGSSVQVRDALPGENLRHRISGEVGTWSAVLLGHQSLEDAVSAKRLRPFTKSSANAASSLFPRRHPFIPPLDHF
jgi:hypothetical protein